MADRVNYDTIAAIYDPLCRLIFGKTIKKAQTDLLHFIPRNASIIIVGGGTGWLLEEISAIYTSGLQITYIDISAKMIGLSVKRNTAANKVTFINQSIEQVALDANAYDVIITPFILDGFPQDVCSKLLDKLHSSLRSGGYWLYSDFQLTGKQRHWQKPLLKLMYLFFRITTHVKAKKLPNVITFFHAHAYSELLSARYCKDFIASNAYRKLV